MIAADTSCFIAFLQGEKSRDCEIIREALSSGKLTLAPVVVTELLSSGKNTAVLGPILDNLVVLELLPGYWHRAGQARRTILERGLKARTIDALIAQACIDHDLSLIARDTDFRHFATYCGLRLA